jgi:hypothetical protein
MAKRTRPADLSDAERMRRVTAVLAEEAQHPLCWIFIDFGTQDQFYGAVVVRARGVVSATLEAHRLGINPGGEALAMSMPDGWDRPEYCNRLLTSEEVDVLPPPRWS